MSIFHLTATGYGREADAAAVGAACSVFIAPGAPVFVQSLPSGKWKVVKADRLNDAVRELAGGKGTYWAFNPLPPGHSSTVKTGDPVSRRWFMIDVDPRKAEGHADDNATDAEHEAAREVAYAINAHLSGAGWPAPVVVDSGNGWNLFYRVDLPNDPMSRALFKRVLAELGERFGAGALIDPKVINANRIAKIPGTWACKGPHTAERPHRPCRMVHCPEIPEVVPAELLAAAGGPEEGPAPATTPAVPATSPFVMRALDQGDGGRAYARRALEGELAKMELAPVGSRNQAYNDAVFNLAQLVAGGCILQQEVEEALKFKAKQRGLDDREIAATWGSAFGAGSKLPRRPPERNGTHAQPVPKDGKEPPKRLTIRASEVQPKVVEWLWPNRVAKHFVTVFAGRTGLGKSFVVCDLIARLTTGGALPCVDDGGLVEQGTALMISEDPYDYMLAPRLIELGADMRRVFFLTWEAMASYALGNTELLERAYEEAERPKLIVIDPPTNFIGEADEHKNAEVRQVVMKVVGWLTERDCAAVFILHVNKQTGKGIEALNRVMGSVAWTTTARVAHSFAPDPEDPTRCLFVAMKNNLGELPKGLAYRITKTQMLARVEWLGEVDTTADEAMNREKKPRRIVASEWLVEKFREKREWLSDDLFLAAKSEGVSRNAIFEAKDRLDLPRARRHVRENGDVYYTWWVPEDWPLLSQATVPPIGTSGRQDSSDEGAF